MSLHCVYSIDLVHVVEIWHVSSNKANPSMLSECRIGRPEEGLVGRTTVGTRKRTFKFGFRHRLIAEVCSLGHLAQAQEQRKGTAKSMSDAETTREKRTSRFLASVVEAQAQQHIRRLILAWEHDNKRITTKRKAMQASRPSSA